MYKHLTAMLGVRWYSQYQVGAFKVYCCFQNEHWDVILVCITLFILLGFVEELGG